MADITYCVNRFCPFEDCDRHLENTKDMPRGTIISVAPLDGVCKRYLTFLVEEETGVEVKEEEPLELEEVKHGFWEKKTDGKVWWYACSVCGEDIPKNRWGGDYFSDGCPRCRAKMDMLTEETI